MQGVFNLSSGSGGGNINGTIKEYQVADGGSVKNGDFVSSAVAFNTTGDLSYQQKENIVGTVQVGGSFFLHYKDNLYVYIYREASATQIIISLLQYDEVDESFTSLNSLSFSSDTITGTHPISACILQENVLLITYVGKWGVHNESYNYATFIIDNNNNITRKYAGVISNEDGKGSAGGLAKLDETRVITYSYAYGTAFVRLQTLDSSNYSLSSDIYQSISTYYANYTQSSNIEIFENNYALIKAESSDGYYLNLISINGDNTISIITSLDIPGRMGGSTGNLKNLIYVGNRFFIFYNNTQIFLLRVDDFKEITIVYTLNYTSITNLLSVVNAGMCYKDNVCIMAIPFKLSDGGTRITLKFIGYDSINQIITPIKDFTLLDGNSSTTNYAYIYNSEKDFYFLSYMQLLNDAYSDYINILTTNIKAIDTVKTVTKETETITGVAKTSGTAGNKVQVIVPNYEETTE